MLNMEGRALDFAIPPIPGRGWYRAIDTACSSAEDIVAPGQEVEEATDTYRVQVELSRFGGQVAAR